MSTQDVAATPGSLDGIASVGATQVLAASRSRYERFVKPPMDRAGAAALGILLFPVITTVAIAVAISLGWPLIFRQTRVGQNGALFTVYKFRTMRFDLRRSKCAFEGPDRRVRHKHPDDPRLTRVGRLLRSSSLDELPQLWNVLRGEMSLVGPRPELPAVVERYVPWQHARHCVKPGLTGLWQVRARGDGRVMHECTDLDLEYVESIGFLTDVKILLLTAPAIIAGRGC
jgi:lipopolysaccharide/colanic/teichoic acid biosynthesis glycosyltransferase